MEWSRKIPDKKYSREAIPKYLLFTSFPIIAVYLPSTIHGVSVIFKLAAGTGLKADRFKILLRYRLFPLCLLCLPRSIVFNLFFIYT